MVYIGLFLYVCPRNELIIRLLMALDTSFISGDSFLGRYAKRLYRLRFYSLLLFVMQLWAWGYYYVGQGRLPYPGEVVYQTLSLLTWSSLPALVAALSPYRWLRKGVQGLTLFVYGYLMLFESFLVFSYSSVYTDSIALNILATNPGEASAFIENLNYKVFLLPLVLLVLLSLLTYAAVRRWGQREGTPVRRALLCGGMLLTIPVSLFIVHPAQRATMSALFMAPVERIYRGTTSCIEASAELAKYSAEARRFDVGAVEHTRDMKGITVVVVLGESMRRDYMHCYGYPLPNTPKQDSLAQTGDLVLFSDAVSSASWTAGSISQSMSFYTREGKEQEWYKYPALSLVLSKAGYYTYWLSNQEKQGSGIQPVPTLASTSDSVRFVRNRTAGDWNASQDEAVLPLLYDQTNLPQGKDLFEVVHLMGSHTPYGARYIHEQATFTPSSLPKTLPNGMPTPTDEKRRGIICDYVNSIHYNDHLMGQIFAHYSQIPALVIYLSDHGQSTFENPERPDYYEHEVSRPGVSIPLMVYVSPVLRQTRPELYEQIVAAKGRRIMTDLLANSISGLLGVKTKYYDPRLDFFAKEYNNARRRLIQAYDGQMVEF